MSLYEGDDVSHSSETEYDEALPFAIHYDEGVTESPLNPSHAQFQQTRILQECSETILAVVQSSTNVVLESSISQQQQPPPLMSSMMSCQTNDSTLASSSVSEAANDGQWGEATTVTNLLSSRQLDTAASLLAILAGNGLQMTLSPSPDHMSSTTTMQQSRSYTSNHPIHNNIYSQTSYSGLGFSRLMQNAGDTSEISTTRDPLPVLPEETEAESFHSAREGVSRSFPTNISSTTSQIMPADWLPVDGATIDSSGGYVPPVLDGNSPQPRYSSRNQADKTGIYARQLDPTSFEVSMEIAPELSVEETMEILGNPSYLSLWCEFVRSMVITNSSEGVTQQRRDERRAVHEGEWIEGSTTDLISPPSTSSCFYSTSKAVWNFVGFPSHYANVSMFVERQQGRLSLSLGPFAGDITLSQCFRVEKRMNFIRIVNRVTLTKDVPHSILMCGVFECLEGCLLPSVKAYMSQTVSSMVRLRVLVEMGEGHFSPQEGFEVIHTQRQRVS